MYTVPKLVDCSPEALDRAGAELFAALDDETCGAAERRGLEDVPRPLVSAQEQVYSRRSTTPASRPSWPSQARDRTPRNELKVDEEAIKEVHAKLHASFSSRSSPPSASISPPGIRRAVQRGATLLLRGIDKIVSRLSRRWATRSGRRSPGRDRQLYNFQSLQLSAKPSGARYTGHALPSPARREPARERLLLRTHTSPVQIRTMEKQPPPVRIVIPGQSTPQRYRSTLRTRRSSIPSWKEQWGTLTSRFSNMKGTARPCHARRCFGSSVKTRFYPSTSPSPNRALQVSCIFSGGEGCRNSAAGWSFAGVAAHV